MNLAMYEPQEWKRGKLLLVKYYKGNDVIKQEDYDYNYWSPHLSSEETEDYVQEINTDLISHQYFRRISGTASSGVFPADFYDIDPNQNYIGGGACISWHYGAANYHVYPIPEDIALGDHCWRCYLPYFLRHTGFDKPKSKTTTTKDDYGNAMVVTENYYYDKTPTLNQLTRNEVLNSKGDLIRAETKYPSDFTNSIQMPWFNAIC